MTLRIQLIALTFSLLPIGLVQAQPEEPRMEPASQPSQSAGKVLQVRGQEIYISLSGRQARSGRLVVVREETIPDPTTGGSIKGRLQIGTIQLHRGGDRFSVARAPAGVVVKPGDIVEIKPSVSSPTPTPAPTPTPTARPVAPSVGYTYRPTRRPMPTVYRNTELQRRNRLLEANLGTSNRLTAGGGYVSYGSKDHYGQFEAEYTHFFYHRVIHSIRFGGGGLLGETFLKQYDYNTDKTNQVSESVRFYYGLAGLDLSLTDWFGVEMEAIFGVTLDSVGGGALGAFRIGRRDGVNVRIGGWLRSYIGHEGFLALEVPIGRWFKLTPRVVIDNMPLGEDLGFRGLLKGELRLGRNFGLTAEVGAAARDANTGGFVGTFGLAAYM